MRSRCLHNFKTFRKFQYKILWYFTIRMTSDNETVFPANYLQWQPSSCGFPLIVAYPVGKYRALAVITEVSPQNERKYLVYTGIKRSAQRRQSYNINDINNRIVISWLHRLYFIVDRRILQNEYNPFNWWWIGWTRFPVICLDGWQVNSNHEMSVRNESKWE